MKQKQTFTIYHGILISLLLHGTVAMPFVLDGFMTPEIEPSPLVLDLQGVISDSQIEERPPDTPLPAEVARETPPPTPPPPEEPEVVVPEPAPPPPQPQFQAAPPQPTPKVAVEQTPQDAQTIKARNDEDEQIEQYARRASKKVRAGLVQPDTGRRATATVSFTVLLSGQLRPDSLKIVASTGQPKLDTSALKSVQASAPFEPPPKELTMKVNVDFGPK